MKRQEPYKNNEFTDNQPENKHNFANDEFLKKSKRGFISILFGRTSIIILLLVIQFAGMFAMFAYFERYLVSLAYGGFAVIGLVMAIYVANTLDNPSLKLSWTVLIMLFPVFGTLLYIFVRKEIGHRLMYRKLVAVLEKTKEYCVTSGALETQIKENDKALYNIANYITRSSGSAAYRCEYAKYFPVGEQMWEEMLKQLEKAEKFIFLEFFIVEEGEMWGKILQILKKKVEQGVTVRIMYDGTCAISLLPYSYPKKLKSMGIQCRMFSPLRPFVSTHYNNRDHRKILVIDGNVAFTGGVNLADEYINRKNRFGHWKDCGIMIKGEAVRSFTLMFLQIWNIAGAPDNFDYYLTPPLDSSSSLSGSDSYSYSSSEVKASGYVIPYGDSPLDNEKVGEAVYMDIINTAQDYVYIMTPYLIIDNEMSTALQNAAKRGVDVRIILPGTPDHKMAFALAKTHYKELIPAGVRIYEYTPGFVHSKLFVSDNIKAVAGTINLDYRSLYLHFECAAYFSGAEVIGDILSDFHDTFGKCNEIGIADIKKQSFFSRLYGGFLKLLAPLM